MISIAVERQVLELLAGGRFSRRRIARLMGVCRVTVDNLARSGPRPRGPLRGVAVADETRAAGSCQTCGASLTVQPCRACRVRDRLRLAAPQSGQSPEPALALALRPEHHERYLQVRPSARARFLEADPELHRKAC